MAYWLVFQGSSWKHEWVGKYLWAPRVGRDDKPRVYWSNMAKVQPGDVIFSGVDKAIRAVSVANAAAYHADYPVSRKPENWGREGWQIDLNFQELSEPLPYEAWLPAIKGEFQSAHSPFNRDGGANQGYLYSLPNSVGKLLIDKGAGMGVTLEESIADALQPAVENETEYEALRKSRIGQGQFRNDLLKRWSGTCPVSGVTHPRLLRASHIKPWSSSNNFERLDVHNGLLLSSIYDAAFDALLITFDRTGAIRLADDFSATEAETAGIDVAARIQGLKHDSFPYLDEHAELMAARLRVGS